MIGGIRRVFVPDGHGSLLATPRGVALRANGLGFCFSGTTLPV